MYVLWLDLRSTFAEQRNYRNRLRNEIIIIILYTLNLSKWQVWERFSMEIYRGLISIILWRSFSLDLIYHSAVELAL